jgi:hypothetical protein
MYTFSELSVLIEAVGTLIDEYGESPDRVALLERLRADRDRLRADIERCR